MLKAPPLNSSYLHLFVKKCNCQTYEKTTISLASDQYRTKVCPEIENLLGLCWSWLHFLDITFIGSMLKCKFVNFFCTPPLLLTSIFEFNTDKCRTEDLRGGAFSIRPQLLLANQTSSAPLTNQICLHLQVKSFQYS